MREICCFCIGVFECLLGFDFFSSSFYHDIACWAWKGSDIFLFSFDIFSFIIWTDKNGVHRIAELAFASRTRDQDLLHVYTEDSGGSSDGDRNAEVYQR